MQYMGTSSPTSTAQVLPRLVHLSPGTRRLLLEDSRRGSRFGLQTVVTAYVLGECCVETDMLS